jgi:hypothetical protein
MRAISPWITSRVVAICNGEYHRHTGRRALDFVGLLAAMDAN